MTRIDDNIKHIAFVTETYAPEINGVAMTLRQIITQLINRSYSIQLIHPRRKDRETMQVDKLDVVNVAGMPIPGYSELQGGTYCRGKLLKLWKQKRPDVIYIATEGMLGFSALSAARKLGIPVLSGFHTNFHQYSQYYKLGILKPFIFHYLRYFHNRTQLTLVPTQVQLEQLKTDGINDVELLARGVDCQLFSPARRNMELRQQWNLSEDDPAVLYVGRIAAEKNIDLAVNAFHEIHNENANAKMIFVGDGPKRRELEEKYPYFIFCGMKQGRELAEHFASADILLFPSRTETFGNVVLEGMASGLAVVALDYAAAHIHITHEHSGIAVNFYEDESYIEEAVSLLQCPTQLKNIRLNARAHAMSISWEQIVNQFENYLYSVYHGDKSYARNQSAETVPTR